MTGYVSLSTLPKQSTSIFIIPEILFTAYTTLPVSIWHIKKQQTKNNIIEKRQKKKIPKSENDDNVIERDLHEELSRAESKAWVLPISLQKSPIT